MQESVENIDATHARVISNEKIAVIYSDGTEKIVSQRYRYSCESTRGRWYLTNIEKVE